MNFGKTQAQFVGTYVGEAFGISTKIPCNYDNLTYYLLLCNFILPLFSIPLTFFMIPDSRMRDPIVVDDGLASTDGGGNEQERRRGSEELLVVGDLKETSTADPGGAGGQLESFFEMELMNANVGEDRGTQG
eukprot:GHVN01058601.1.p2 GENE.GHVN01058601.1~~GHVN01058601.1.p2  ORF type:complete len:132 (-),score=13.01 GHVN01058601.1:1459-1854(-)